MLTATGLKRKELGSDGRKLFRHDGKQVLVIAHEGRLFAIANRCPHEGYPLSEGTLGPGCVLTFNWHNWKFDLGSGAALVGRDPVRTYDVAERNGKIFIELGGFRCDPGNDRFRRKVPAGCRSTIFGEQELYYRPRWLAICLRYAMRALRSVSASTVRGNAGICCWGQVLTDFGSRTNARIPASVR